VRLARLTFSRISNLKHRELWVKQNPKAEAVIAEACAAAMTAGANDWATIRDRIKAHIAALPSDEQAGVQDQLRLMISREIDQSHTPVTH
jgi:hypothetical protein